ncbi:RING-type E3 ubiquitin transferase [Salvia divinorum]|uniref:RING-type E3 ubiquitin transferase n=1 Tax=Salvia divinorum TaxID=28513 RepID=A0ABD1HID8_SALDI
MWMNDVEVSTKVVNQPLRHIDFPHLSIKFNFSFHTKHYDYLINVANPRLLPSISAKRNTTATVIFRERLSHDAVQKAITDHIGSYKHLRVLLTQRTWEKVVKAIGATGTVPKYVELNVDLTIQMKYSYVHIIGINDMAILGLKICFDPETRCCICTKEIGGDTVRLRMPCEHAFHGGCTVRWLQRNRNCPLCEPTMDWCMCFSLFCLLEPLVSLCLNLLV